MTAQGKITTANLVPGETRILVEDGPDGLRPATRLTGAKVARVLAITEGTRQQYETRTPANVVTSEGTVRAYGHQTWKLAGATPTELKEARRLASLEYFSRVRSGQIKPAERYVSDEEQHLTGTAPEQLVEVAQGPLKGKQGVVISQRGTGTSASITVMVEGEEHPRRFIGEDMFRRTTALAGPEDSSRAMTADGPVPVISLPAPDADEEAYDIERTRRVTADLNALLDRQEADDAQQVAEQERDWMRETLKEAGYRVEQFNGHAEARLGNVMRSRLIQRCTFLAQAWEVCRWHRVTVLRQEYYYIFTTKTRRKEIEAELTRLGATLSN